ncbi:MocR-like transcription factor YczR [Salinifilum ghardaiensis]
MATRGVQISGRRIAALLGEWRNSGNRRAVDDLSAAIRLQVLDGKLPVGTQLPAERELAEALGASRTLISRTLDALREEGLVTSRRGAGSWVSPPAPGRPREAAAAEELIDFARAAPEAVPGFVPAVDAARARLPELLGGTGYFERGVGELREQLAQRYTARGLPTKPAEILVSSGGHAGFVWILHTLVHPGERVLTEQPTYPNALDAVRARNAIAVPAPVHGEDGWIDAITAGLRQTRPSLAYLIPDFQNPTGMRMGAEGRQQVGEALAATGTVAVADETMVEFDFSGAPGEAPLPLAAYAPGNVIAIGSASKSHWGGLRLGWLRAPENLVERLLATRATVDLGSPALEQLVLAELLAHDGNAMRDRRTEFARRRDILVAELHQHCPQWTITAPPGGLSLSCELDEPVSTRLAVAAENHGLRLVPGSRFGVHGGLERALRLPFSLPPDTLRQAVPRLALAAASIAGAGRHGAGSPHVV